MTARGASARRKGHTFERELARDLGTSTTRNTRPGTHEDAGDLVLAGWYVEAKACEAWRVEEWWKKATANAVDGQRVAVLMKRDQHNFAQSLVVVSYATWKEMLS